MTAMIQVRTATTSEEVEAVQRFRYSIYVEEMGRYHDSADHERRLLADPEDDQSWVVYATDGTEIVGAVRVTWGGHGFSPRQIEQYQLGEFLAEVPARHLAVGERTMISPRWRGIDLFPTLAEGTTALQQAHDIRAVFGACEPHLISFYLRFQRPYSPRNINSAEAGYLIPLLSYPNGPEALDGFGPDGGLPRCVGRSLRGTGAVTSPMLEDPDAYFDSVIDELASVEASVFDGMTRHEQASVLARSNVIACRAGDRLLKTGGAARNVFVVLGGALESSSSSEVVGRVHPGEVVGEMAYLLERPRGFDVDVVHDGTRVLSLSEHTLRTLTTDHPVAAAKLATNLSKQLCLRLIRTTAA